MWRLIAGLILARSQAFLFRRYFGLSHALPTAVAERQIHAHCSPHNDLGKSRALVRQHHMARLAALALPDGQRIGIGIEVAHFQLRKLAVAAAGFQPSAHQRAKFRLRTC